MIFVDFNGNAFNFKFWHFCFVFLMVVFAFVVFFIPVTGFAVLAVLDRPLVDLSIVFATTSGISFETRCPESLCKII